LMMDIYFDKKEIYAKETNANIFTVILTGKYISEFCNAILYFVSYGIKKSFLIDDEMLYWKVDNESQPWRQLTITEFYWTFFMYFVDNIIESFIFFFCFWRFCMLFYTIHRVKSFAFFIYYSMTKIYSFLIIMIGIVIAFAVVSNNLFGSYGPNYVDFLACFSNVLMISIGHFPTPDKRVERYWLSMFILLVLIIIVFFFLSTFAGMFLESFRIVSLRKGYAFDKKDMDSDNFFRFLKKINKRKLEELKNQLEKAIKDGKDKTVVKEKKSKDFNKVKKPNVE
jgi:hypothetical protein